MMERRAKVPGRSRTARVRSQVSRLRPDTWPGRRADGLVGEGLGDERAAKRIVLARGAAGVVGRLRAERRISRLVLRDLGLGPAVVVALHLIAAPFLEHGRLTFGLYAFRRYGDVQRLAEADDARDDGARLRARAQCVDEGAVDLDRLDREAL